MEGKFENKSNSKILDILLEERKIVLERIARIDKLLFSFISVVLSPFIILMGYSLLNSNTNYKYILITVPFFCLLGGMLMGLLYMHHYITGYYRVYLIKKINHLMKESPLLLEELDYNYYSKGFNIQNVLIALVTTIILFTNAFLFAKIASLVEELSKAVTPLVIFSINLFVLSYWGLLSVYIIVFIISFYVQFIQKTKVLDKIIKSNLSEEIDSYKIDGY